MAARGGEWVGTVRDWMSRAPVHVASGVPVAHVAGLMRSEAIRHVLVMDGDVLAGVVSDRDVRRVRTEGESGVGPSTPVARVMSEPVVTVAPDTPLVEAVRAMLEHKIGAVVVLDSGRPVGIVTRSDALEALLNAVESTGGRSSAPSGQA
jgi:CBS domain-containing protein